MELILSNLPAILCFIFGIVLLIMEAFLPGFGIPGITGALLEAIAVLITWINNGPTAAVVVLVIALCVLAIAVSMSLRSLSKGKLSNSSIVLKDRETAEAGYSASEDLNVFMGREGVATSILRPTGIADFSGIRLDVATEGDFIQEGSLVKIVRIDGNRVFVRKLDEKA